MAQQTSSGRPNAVVDEEMNPSSQPPARSSAPLALIVFVLFCAAGVLVWFAL